MKKKVTEVKQVGGKMVEKCEGCTRTENGRCKLYVNVEAQWKYLGCAAKHVILEEKKKAVFTNPIKAAKRGYK